MYMGLVGWYRGVFGCLTLSFMKPGIKGSVADDCSKVQG